MSGAEFPRFATDAVHAGQDPEQWSSRAIVPPITLSANFKQYEAGVPSGGYVYCRSGNPTRRCLETCLAKLEGAKHGIVVSSGIAATTTISHLLKAGDHMVIIDDVYSGNCRYFQQLLSRFDIELTFCNMLHPENLKGCMKPNTKLVWLETPSNPLLQVVDIKALSAVAHEQDDVLVVVDNTFATPFCQRPLELGADISYESVSKYISGHSDVIMGGIFLNDDAVGERLRLLQKAVGAVPSPFDCFLVNRGVKTLHVRMKEHMKNALGIARALEKNPRVAKVVYPGLESHPQYELAREQMKGSGGMVTFFIKGGMAEAKKFLANVKVFTLAESLGGVESLCEHPAIMTHSCLPKEQREALGILDSLVRLSVGLEDLDVLVADLEQALDAAVNNKNDGITTPIIQYTTNN